jgi:hypothetical protein
LILEPVLRWLQAEWPAIRAPRVTEIIAFFFLTRPPEAYRPSRLVQRLVMRWQVQGGRRNQVDRRAVYSRQADAPT